MIHLTKNTQIFIENNIEFIDSSDWIEFFKHLFQSFISFGEANDIIEFFILNGIEFNEKSRKQIFESYIDIKLKYLRQTEFQIDLQDFFYKGRSNWLGYTIEDMEKYLERNQFLLNIEIKKWSNSPNDSQIIFVR